MSILQNTNLIPHGRNLNSDIRRMEHQEYPSTLISAHREHQAYPTGCRMRATTTDLKWVSRGLNSKMQQEIN